ncbi:ERCC1 protein, partial [Certhia brachydactyla]|nr:ERCC1 protein [Certhia brachydactyla]
VSCLQRGNPVLKFIRNVPWEFGDIVPDYVLGQSSCALFLRDPHQSLKDLAKVCLLTDCTLLLAWRYRLSPNVPKRPLLPLHLSPNVPKCPRSAEEAARYLETFKSYEQKPPDLLKERVEQDFLSRVTDCLTSVKSVNKTDVLSLMGTFGSLAAVVGASREDLSLCPGVGPQKAKRLFDVLHQPFLKTPR